MRYAEAAARLRRMFAERGLAPDALEPWDAWKVFKAYLRTPVDAALDGVVDDAVAQYGVYLDADGAERAHLYLAREFSTPEGQEGGGALPVTHVVCDLAFEPGALPRAARGEFWTQDAPTLEAFVDHVEADAGFQALMGARPLNSSVYVEEC